MSGTSGEATGFNVEDAAVLCMAAFSFLGEWWCVSKDIRTLCASCLSEYKEAGYDVRLIWSDVKEECDRCRVRYGWQYEIKKVCFGKRNKK